MPIVHFVNCKSQSAGGMKTTLGYVSQEKKTVIEDRRYVTGINCIPTHAYNEMMLTKKLYGKTGGRQYYHLVQSFPKGFEITPEQAHKIACEFAETAFGKYECVVATHIDREHIHSHIVFNSVSFEDGRKYHSNLNSVKELMRLSDEICLQHGVSVLEESGNKLKKKTDKMTDREYRSALKGESRKIQLMSAITECMKVAKSKRQFCFLMSRYGYKVRWEENRKHIIYTTPKGYKVRDKRLHDEKYLKEAMENEFGIRYAVLNGEEQTAAATDRHSDNNGGDNRTALADGSRGTDQRGGVAGQGHQNTWQNNDGRADENVFKQSSCAVGAEQGGAQSLTGADNNRHLSSNAGNVITGWENERAILINAERARRVAAEAKAESYQSYSDLTVGAADIIGGVTDIASIIDSAPTDPEELERYIDSIRAAQNFQIVMDWAIKAIEILSDRLEEMKAGQEESEEISM